MVLIMTMVLMIDDNDDDCEDVDNGDGEAAFEDLHVATKETPPSGAQCK